MSKTKKTYAVEPQRATGVGWELCLPADAERFVLVELTIWHQKSGKGFRRQFRKRRILETFDSEATANAALRHTLRRQKPGRNYHV